MFSSSYAARLEYLSGIIKFESSPQCQQNLAKVRMLSEQFPARINTFFQASHAIFSDDPTEYFSNILCIYSVIPTW